MNSDDFKKYGADLIGNGYADIADQALRSRERQTRELLQHRRLPVEGWDDLAVSVLLQQLAMTDGNNQLHRVGVGEREGRVFSRVVAERHFHLIHGIGRSGELTAPQPKAPGSSLLYGLTRRLALHAVHLCGIKAASRCLVVPLSTGMALSLCFSTLRHLRPAAARFIVLSRIDQGSCVKSIYHAGFEAAIVHTRLVGDGLRTDLSAIDATVNFLGEENILCVVSTTSTFAPREPDDIEAIAKLCKQKNIPHIVNNAYGLQCSACCHRIEQGLRTGRVDAFVQSTDKNFMTPVGGALICSADPDFLDKVAANYPGRASASPILDLFITLLQMGQTGLRQLLTERKELHAWFNKELRHTCSRLGLRVLHVPTNKISTAIDLSSLERPRITQQPQLQQQEQQEQQYEQTEQEQQLQCGQAQLQDKRDIGGEPQPSKEERNWQSQQQQQDPLANECPQQQEGQRPLSQELQKAEQPRKRVTPRKQHQDCSAGTSTKQQQSADLRQLGSFLFYRRCSGLRVVWCSPTASSLSTSSLKVGMPHARQQWHHAANQQLQQGLEMQTGKAKVSPSPADSCGTLVLLPLQQACASHLPSFSPRGLQCILMLRQQSRNYSFLGSSAAGAAGNSNTVSPAAVSHLATTGTSQAALKNDSPAATPPASSGHAVGTAAEGSFTAAEAPAACSLLVVDTAAEASGTHVLTAGSAGAAPGVPPASDNCVADSNATSAGRVSGGSDAVVSTVSSSVAAAAFSTPDVSDTAEASSNRVAAGAAGEALATSASNAAASYAVAAPGVSERTPFATKSGRNDGALLPGQKRIGGHVLSNWGSHCENYPVSYCTVAVAIGAQKGELETFLHRFELAVRNTHKQTHRGPPDAKNSVSASITQ